MSKSSGFTLVELLISLSIIAIMSAIGFMTYTSVSRQGRDSKRQSDLRSIQSALEDYYRDQGFFPDAVGLNAKLNLASTDRSTTQIFTNTTGNPGMPAITRTYLNVLPVDPIYKSTGRYFYSTPSPCDNLSTKCTSYCLFAKLENSTPGTGTCSNGTYNFAVTSP